MRERNNIFQVRSRELDYLQKDWLEKTTGTPAANWDIYVVKELIDNALDADEDAGIEPIKIKIDLRYTKDEKLDLFSLAIDVGNQASFPVDQLPNIFALTQYVSSKSGRNTPSRGKQGNALKTIAGIPYALRHFHYGDYDAKRRPIMIETGGHEYTVAYQINELTDQVTPLITKRRSPKRDDKFNWLRIGIDRFHQQTHREIKELVEISRALATFNPHVDFQWHALMGEEEASWSFKGGKDWMGRFHGVAPVTWYDVAQFREYILYVARSRSEEVATSELFTLFPGFDKRRGAQISKTIPRTLGEVLKSTRFVESLYGAMIAADQTHANRITVADLGGLGETSIHRSLTEFFGSLRQTVYREVKTQDELRPSCPFVLEVFGARLEDGMARIIWTGTNNTISYGDPFARTTLTAAGSESSASVRGLREFVEAFGVTPATPFLVAIHLICPNFNYQDFSKTLIDAGPFRAKLEEALSEVLQELSRGEQEAQKEQAAILRRGIKRLIPIAIQDLSPGTDDRFSLDQLVLRVRHLYAVGSTDSKAPKLPTDNEIRVAIKELSLENPTTLSKLIRKSVVQIYLPAMNGSIAVAINAVSDAILAEACVNKILVFSDHRVAEVFVANGLSRRFDVGVLAIDGDSEVFEESLDTIAKWKMPLLLGHDGSLSGCTWHRRLQQLLSDSQITLETPDLGLTPGQGKMINLTAEQTGITEDQRSACDLAMSEAEMEFLLTGQIYRLLGLSSRQLLSWMRIELARLGIAEKWVPENRVSRLAAQRTFRQALEKWVLEQIGSKIKIDVVVDTVVTSVRDDWKIEDLITRIDFDSEDSRNFSWYQRLQSLVTSETQKRLKKNSNELRRLVFEKAGIA